MRDYYLRHTAKTMLTTAKNRAKVKGLPFNLTEADVQVPAFCPVLGVKLESGIEGSGHNDNAPSLDRIVPALGYVRGNVVVVSNKANRMKNNGTPAELRAIADFYTQLTKEQQCPEKIISIGRTDSARSTASPRQCATKKKKGTMHLLLIDGDILAYRAAFGSEQEIMLEDDVATYTADLDEARTRLFDRLEDIKERLNGDKVVVALSDSEKNFRKEIFAPYKENRKHTRKPLALKHIRRVMQDKLGALIKEGLEADDVIGILGTHPDKFSKFKKIIVSSDKDLLQIPVRHFDPEKDIKRIVKPDEGFRTFLYQTLIGDVVDHYPGCPGIGPKRAKAILDEDTSWDAVLAAFEKTGLSHDDALVQARVARILTADDYDFKKQRPILWKP